MAGEVSSDWTSFSTSGPSSPPPTTRRLPQKIRGRMPRRSKASSYGENVSPFPTLISGEALAVVSSTPSQISEESIRKLVDQISLPTTYDWLRPSPSQFANNPPEGIPPSQLLPNSYRSDFYSDKPSSHGAWKTRFFFVRKPLWDVPLVWDSSLNPLPPLNIGEIKRRMLDVGLVEHEFKGKAILEEELLIVAGLHPAPDRYEGPLDAYSRLRIMMNCAAVRKFIPEDVPAIPPSPLARSVSSTPSDLPPSGVPHKLTPAPPQSYTPAFPQGTPVIESKASPLSQKRPRLEEVQREETPTGGSSEPLVFPAQVLTPRLEPRAGVFNMSRTINRADVELLATSSVTGAGNFVIMQVSAIPAAIAAMVEKHGALIGGHEAVRRELQDTQVKLSQCQQRLRRKGREELESLKAKLVENEGQVVALSMENEAVKASTVQAYT
ncbi:hypothetical protein Salat_1654100 [Sesamum alatum]|uniref:Uncharacterized protein n=1 Tax=Sesamum alatum TaxID=300844 RepID=A0AAE1Y6R7_9LAMI|nr:hypothetical protein Salat_1654100 [Sesamum alatum]